LADLRTAESNAAHDYDMLKQLLTDHIAADNTDKDDEASAKNAAEQTKAAEGDLTNTVKDLAYASTASRNAELKRSPPPVPTALNAWDLLLLTPILVS